MIQTHIKLHQQTQVMDEYGGAKDVLNYLKEVSGYIVSENTETLQEGAKNSVKTTIKYVCNDRLLLRNLIAEYNGVYYDVTNLKNLYSKGCSMELVNIV